MLNEIYFFIFYPPFNGNQKDGLVISYVNITDVRVEDGGTYSCKADNGLASVQHAAKINVLGPPVVRPMRNITVVASEPLIVRCPVGGYPLESISWERGNQWPHHTHIHTHSLTHSHHMHTTGTHTAI